MAKAQILPFWNEQFGRKPFFSNQLWGQSILRPSWMRIASWCRFDELMGVAFVAKVIPSSLCKDLKTFEVTHKVRVFLCP